MSTTDLALYQPQDGEMRLWRPPETVLAEAQQAASSLQKILAGKPNKVMFNGEQYLELEDWETLGHFYGYAAKIEATNFLQFGDKVQGYEAFAVLINERTGIAVGRAEAMCLNDEENWGMVPEYEWKDVLDAGGNKIWDKTARQGKGGYVREKVLVGERAKPLFQIRSMAQTRACAKAFRNKLAWVAVLAGYKPTPAEEMDANTVEPSEPTIVAAPLPTELKKKESGPVAVPERTYAPVQEPVRQVAPATGRVIQPPKPPAPTKPVISEAQARRFYAIAKQHDVSAADIKIYLREKFGVEEDRQIPRDGYEEACAWLESA